MIKWKLITHKGKDIINVTHAENKSEAEYIFAKVKNMPLVDFLKLFKVVKYEE